MTEKQYAGTDTSCLSLSVVHLTELSVKRELTVPRFVLMINMYPTGNILDVCFDIRHVS